MKCEVVKKGKGKAMKVCCEDSSKRRSKKVRSKRRYIALSVDLLGCYGGLLGHTGGPLHIF
eukprot:scaffold95065_cov48-Phaeocystis_antarctica.AAC.1